MPRSFDVVTESPASVEQIRAAFGREDYWRDRMVADDSTTLDSLRVDPDGTVTVQLTLHLARQVLPGPVAQVVPADFKLYYTETWRPVDGGHALGEGTVSASGGLGSSRVQNILAPAGTGSQLRSALKVEVKIPLVGGRLEKTIGAGLAESIPATLHFTTAWVAEHG
jgi:hypothetical protein